MRKKMACEAVEMWSLSSLIAAFLDLTIAYLLLCASAVAFFASKFLNFFGLSLPCPCDGLFFGIRSQRLCLNRLLVDFPTQKVSDVLLYVKQFHPFSGCVWTDTNSTCVRTNTDSSIAGNSSGKEVLQLDFDASCSSISEARRLLNDSGDHGKDLIVRDEKKYDVKGKGIVCHKPRTRLRSRGKWSNDHGKNMSLSSYNRNRGEEALAFAEERQRALTNVMMNYCPDEDPCSRNISSALKLHDDSQGYFLSSSGDDKKRAIRALEKALVEERARRAALYIELEKERSAAATAADEAMSMILRLQEEKACIEMEARQYQRIIEEKSAYDAEEMNILKEILVRREKEKLFLEKEVEGYRLMMSMKEDDDDNEFSGDALDKFCSPPQVAAFTEKQVARSIIQEHGDLPEISMQMPPEHKFLKKIDFSTDAQEVDETENLSPEEKIIVTCDKIETGNSYKDTSMEQQAKDLNSNYSGDFASYPDFNNFHNVIKESDFSAGSSSSHVLQEINYVPVETSMITSVDTVTNYPSTSRTDRDGTYGKRSSSEITNVGLPPIRPRALSLLSEPRRNSMSCADNEILRTDSELGKLLEKLKLVQEGRDKLISPSIEDHEKEDMKTKSLDDIEARHLSDSGKVSPQVLSRKRRCRSVSSGLWRASKGKYDAYDTRI